MDPFARLHLRLSQTQVWRDRIEQARAAHPLEVVAAQYTELAHRGREWIGRCPLHEERTPSFTVTPRNQKWFCFGCNTGGDVFKLIQLVERVTFQQALAQLESQAGTPTPIRSFTPGPEPPARALTADETRLLTQVAEIYHTALWSERKQLDYLAQRQITPSVIERHWLGYARPGDLLKHFPTAADRARLTALHLLNDEGCEHFSHRVMFPELREGKAIYLVGRATRSAQRAKYLGLTDVPKPLYGAEHLAAQNWVLLCEGPTDWLTLDDWGYPTVALLGAYLKPNQVADLANTRTVLIATDSDETGRQAAARLAAQLAPRAHILPPLPGGAKDVNELAQTPDGRTRFAELVASVHIFPSN